MGRSKPGVRVVGLRQFQKQLTALGDDAVDELKRAHLEAAKIVEGEAKRIVPRHGSTSVISGTPYWRTPPHASGNMANTIRSAGQRRGGYVRAGRKAVPYAGPVHFGWPNRPNEAKEWQGGPIAPNPFLYSALDARRDQVEFAFSQGLMKLARKKGLA